VCLGKYKEYQELSAEVLRRNVAFVEKTLENHILKRNRLVDVKCRSVLAVGVASPEISLQTLSVETSVRVCNI